MCDEGFQAGEELCKAYEPSEGEKSRASLTVAYNIAVLVFDNSKERGPSDEVVEVEVNVVVFRQRVEISEIDFEEILGSESAERCHD